MRLSKQAKQKIWTGVFFIIGVITTIIITKASNKIAPDEPLIVKQYTDTIKIIHDYKLPKDLNNDTIREELETKIKNLELLNNYDKKIKERLVLIKSSNQVLPNLILTNKVKNISQKGFMQESASSYFSAKCPKMNSEFIDIKLNFLNPAITKDIEFLRVNIYKFDNLQAKESTIHILEDYYEVKPLENFIRINNDFQNGKYEIIFGFIFKNDLNKYPKFYFKKCVVTKS
jgi:hypothetical protein